jgi:hypothetical protein
MVGTVVALPGEGITEGCVLVTACIWLPVGGVAVVEADPIVLGVPVLGPIVPVPIGALPMALLPEAALVEPLVVLSMVWANARLETPSESTAANAITFFIIVS